MIQDVKIKELKFHADDRGVFTEIMKEGEETFKEIKQTNYTETYPGVIKAFHAHKKQWDVWFVVKGAAQVVLHDLRKDSKTFQETNTFCLSERNSLLILIPPGVAHGYKVLGQERVGLFYHVSEPYDPKNPDEERIPFNDPQIGYDWETKNR